MGPLYRHDDGDSPAQVCTAAGVVPSTEVEAASHISPELEERVWDDIISASHMAPGGTTLRRRIMIGQRLMKNRWKFKEYADVSAGRFLLEEFRGWAFSHRLHG